MSGQPLAVGGRAPALHWRASELGGLDLLHGTFTTHAFARHTHDTYSIGLLGHGAMTFDCRGAAHTLRPGLIGVIHPDEVHDGHAETADGWTYRNFYPDAPLLQGAFTDPGEDPHGLPRLPVVIDDPRLFQALVTAHQALGEGASSLARESLMLGALTRLVGRHAAQPPMLKPALHEPAGVHLVRAVLEDEFARNVTLDELAATTGLNPFTLLRVFRRTYGLPPHAYQLQIRLRHAKRLLRAGEAVASAALLAGFADQSHFGRHFRRTFGVTPQQYRRGVKNVLSS